MEYQNTFIGQVLDGRSQTNEIDDVIEEWHGRAHGDPVELHEFLGMTPGQYALWVGDPSSLDGIIRDVRREQSLIGRLTRGEDADAAACEAAWVPSTGASIAEHLGMTDAEHARYAADKSSLSDIVRERKRSDALRTAFDILTAYMTDECPDDQSWEDFDPDVDGIRSQIDEALGSA